MATQKPWEYAGTMIGSMVVQREDYFERMIKAVAAGIAHALGLAKSGQHEEAQAAIDNAWFGALGLRRRDLDRMDGATLRAILGSKREAAARLLEAEAQLRTDAGDSEGATRSAALVRAISPS